MHKRSQTLFPEIAATELRAKPISVARLPTNTTTYRHPIHRWFNFIAGFSPEFVAMCFDRLGGKPQVYLDPFAGCATGPLAACERSVRAIGYEPHPILARIGRAKLPSSHAARQVVEIGKTIAHGLASPLSLDTLPTSPREFLTKLFSKESLSALLGARLAIEESEFRNNDLAFLVLSKVLDECSHSQTDGIYKAPDSRKTAQPPLDAMKKILDQVSHDLNDMGRRSYASIGKIYECSSNKMTQVGDNEIDIIITSPPYLNNFDFAEMTRMYLYFWGMAESWGDITNKVRSKLIVNTTTALNGHKKKQQEYRTAIPSELHEEIDVVVEQLREQRKQRAGKKEYDFLVYPYLSQLTEILKECHRCMKANAPLHLMIADAALYGIHISTPQWIAQLLECFGFKDIDCEFVRKRGHRWILDKRDGSKRGLGEYHIFAVK